jgi:hypothetical protein
MAEKRISFVPWLPVGYGYRPFDTNTPELAQAFARAGISVVRVEHAPAEVPRFATPKWTGALWSAFSDAGLTSKLALAALALAERKPAARKALLAVALTDAEDGTHGVGALARSLLRGEGHSV